jgi:tetratricopeptide (TPR) repeat protein
VAFLVWYGSQKQRLGGDNKVVLAEFSNTTGDAVFDAALRQGLAAQLEQSPFLGVVSDARIAQTMQLMAQPKGARVIPELARQVCQRTGSAATIEGSISGIGSQYVVGLRALNCQSGDLLAQVQETADRKEQVLTALGLAATKLRRKLGESLPSVKRYDAPPENVTTGSLEALEAYGLGVEAMNRWDGDAAIAHFQRAIALDPEFAMAYGRLGVVQNGTAQAQENTRKAYALRDRVSDREKFYLVSHYQQYATGNLEAARKTLEEWAQTYPHDSDPAPNLLKIHFATGAYEQALTVMRGIIQNSPGTPGNNAARLATTLMFLNRFDEAKVVLADAAAHHLDGPVQHYYRYEICFLEHDTAGMEKESAYLHTQPGWEGNTLELESLSAAYGGQFAKSRDLNERVTEASRRAHENDDAAGNLSEAALQEALAGDKAIADAKAKAALALSNGQGVETNAGLALALAGNATEANRVANDLNKQFPEDTIAQMVITTIRACALLGNGNSSDGARRAAEAMGSAAPYELNGDLFLIPVYVRGQAYLSAGQSAQAQVEFQKILDHSGVTRNFITGALAHLEMARALTLAGDKGKARAAYQDFFALWKDADPQLATLKQAQAEYAHLGN